MEELSCWIIIVLGYQFSFRRTSRLSVGLSCWAIISPGHSAFVIHHLSLATPAKSVPANTPGGLTPNEWSYSSLPVKSHTTQIPAHHIQHHVLAHSVLLILAAYDVQVASEPKSSIFYDARIERPHICCEAELISVIFPKISLIVNTCN